MYYASSYSRRHKPSKCSNCGQYHSCQEDLIKHLKKLSIYKFQDIFNQYSLHKKQKKDKKKQNYNQIRKNLIQKQIQNERKYINQSLINQQNYDQLYQQCFKNNKLNEIIHNSSIKLDISSIIPNHLQGSSIQKSSYLQKLLNLQSRTKQKSRPFRVQQIKQTMNEIYQTSEKIQANLNKSFSKDYHDKINKNDKTQKINKDFNHNEHISEFNKRTLIKKVKRHSDKNSYPQFSSSVNNQETILQKNKSKDYLKRFRSNLSKLQQSPQQAIQDENTCTIMNEINQFSYYSAVKNYQNDIQEKGEQKQSIILQKKFINQNYLIEQNNNKSCQAQNFKQNGVFMRQTTSPANIIQIPNHTIIFKPFKSSLQTSNINSKSKSYTTSFWDNRCCGIDMAMNQQYIDNQTQASIKIQLIMDNWK